MKIKKISENVYEIPKEGKMNVPGIIYASDKLMKNIEKDKTLEQVKNVAMLPGIVGKSVVMPDAHQGYGFSIGGVAAFDLEKGVISPGGVGYDINCLTGDSKILTEFGQSIKIEDFDQLKKEIEVEQNGRKLKKILFASMLPTINLENKQIECKRINFIMSRDTEDVYEVTLKSGLKIRATADHLFLTKEGMRRLTVLFNHKLAVNLFEGIEGQEVISKKEAITAKVFGYLMGDGTFYESNDKLFAVAYGSSEDLKSMQNDLERIKVKSSFYSRTRKHKIITRYGEKLFEATNHELHIHSKEFLELLRNLGMPLGNKTRQIMRVPDWVKEGSRPTKRLFLAGFFGAEMSSPSRCSKTCFYRPTIDQNKIIDLKQDCRNFLIDITLLLEEFGINDYTISEMEDFKNKYEEKTVRLRLMILGEENIIKLWRKIGFEYNQKRQNMANIASLYILLKNKENNKRRVIAEKVKKYKSNGLKLKEVQKIFEGEINARFVERHYYENAKQRINLDFMSFNDFKDMKLKELEEFGCIFDEIERIEKIKENCKVYDFNIQDNHNFIANGFIVSNCGVRLLTTNIKKVDFMFKRNALINEIYKLVPSGVGEGTKERLDLKEIDIVLKEGAKWALEKGYATKEDVKNSEDNGRIDGADASKVSQRAKSRGKNQLGTLGSGNHFLEIQEIENIFDEKTAKQLGIEKDNIAIMIHTGSRGLGHQVASDYIEKMEKEYGWKNLPDRELICAPIKSKLGEDYKSAMNAAANFAFANRQLITFQVRKAFEKFFPKSKLTLLYDIAHNIAKFEEFNVNGKKQVLCVHRKGATRSKPGIPIILPGSMGTHSYVLIGTKQAEDLSFASTAHGAGRVLSRSYAVRNLNENKLKDELKEKDIILKAGSMKGALEEAPEAYKDIDEVARVSNELGIGQLVARLKPLAVMKG